jgi:hypothetical protein
MVKTLRERNQSRQAYTLVDLSDLEDELQKDIILDASEGGGIYGVRVVEESVNGPARAPIYGVYNDGPDADRWVDAKKQLGITGSEVDDSEVRAGAGVEITDPRRAAAIREAAARQVENEADAIRRGEDAEVEAITGAAPTAPAGGTTGGDHAQNIVDETLDSEANNEAFDPEAAEAASKAAKKSPNKAPK